MRRGVIVGVVVLGAIVIGFLLWRALAPRAADARALSGYVEGESLYLSPPIAGAVTSVSVVRGQRVTAGAPLFTVDARTLSAERAQAEAQLDQARAQTLAAQDAVRQQSANLAAAQAQAANAARDAARYAGVSSGAVSRQDLDRALTASKNANAGREAAAQQVRAAQSQAAAAKAAADHARAALTESQARLDQLSVKAPASGRIEEVYEQAGEWAPANQPVVSLIPDGKVRLRFYVPEAEMALYQPGRVVQFHCDGCRAGLEAVISYVSPRPEYTPPVIYSLKSRDRMVFLVEAQPRAPEGLSPGLPVDVVPLAPAGASGR
jgi:HlyD family secretion protein